MTHLFGGVEVEGGGAGVSSPSIPRGQELLLGVREKKVVPVHLFTSASKKKGGGEEEVAEGKGS